MKLTSRNGRLSCIGCLLALPWLFMLVLLAGCPGGGIGNNNNNNNGNDNSGGSGAGEIVTPSSSFGLSLLDPPFQVRYNVPTSATNVQGYRFLVADSAPNSPGIGDPVVIASGLQSGDSQFFDFDPSEAGVGYFRVGVSFTYNGEADFAESSGVIQVQGSPDPVFVQPANSLTIVEQGSVVAVSFDARDPENEVQWRLFFLDSDDTATAPPDRIGTQLAVGSGNVGNVSFRTEGIPVGDYILGLSATDSGMSVAATVAAGQLDRIVTIPAGEQTTPSVRIVTEGTDILPTITITNPTGADVELFKDETFTIEFTASVPQTGATGTIEVFYDTDTNVNNGFVLIAEDLPSTATEVEWPTGVPEGEYFVGATIRDGVNPAVTDYSAGQVIVVRTITLVVTEPNTTLAVAPNTPVSIEWTTNAPEDSGTVDVFAQRLNSANQPTGAIIPIITEGEMSLRTASFTSATTGLFQITVRLDLEEGNPITGTAPRPVRVSTLPAIAWLGSIAESEPRIDGAIFGGVNFEDNAGSSFTKAADFDGDGLNEFVIGARYAKPFFVNPSGVGPGEAYVLYGERGTGRLRGLYNLNSVGTSLLRGLTLTGVRTIADGGQTQGLADVLSVPDSDGDGKDELAFGFPYVANTLYSDDRFIQDGGTFAPGFPGFEWLPHFLTGGVIILSSENSDFADPTIGVPVINLDRVGQSFSNETIEPFNVNLVWDDQFAFEEGDPDEGTEDGCVFDQTDGVLETVIGPDVGFVAQLGTPQWVYMALTIVNPDINYINGDEEEEEELCALSFDLPVDTCTIRGAFFAFQFQGRNFIEAGSGFFPSDSQPVEPLGARILGRAEDDRFGSSMTIARPSGDDGRPELVITAPARTATFLEVDNLNAPEIENSGIAYITRTRNLWGEDPFVPGIPPKPHQYVINYDSHCGDDRADPIDPRYTNLAVGDLDDNIENVVGIDDFNGDGRGDLVIGSPTAGNGEGRAYIVYRREPGQIGLEGDMVLGELRLDPNDPERLDGLLVTSDTTDGLGSSIASGLDFNGDGISDIVVGSPNAGSGTGEVIVLFGDTGIVSELEGITVSTLLTQRRTPSGAPVAVRIRGATVGGEKGLFGFNVANAGDVDGDGTNDLLIAAPEASPRFDSSPNDGVDELTTLGVDNNLDGVADQVPGDDQLNQAGLVYLILGSNRLDQIRTCQGTSKSCLTAADCPQGAACQLTDATINIDQLGTSRLRGLIVAGRRAGDRIGGGDASDPSFGGINSKEFGRSRGLATAGDVDGDGRADVLIGALTADPRRDPNTGVGVSNGGEAYLLYGSNVP